MNRGEHGRPFLYPEPFIQCMACIHLLLQMPYRQMEGFSRKLSTFIPNLRSADYTTLFRRIKRLDLSLNVHPELLSDDLIVAVDSTGIKVTNRGEWMREKWKVRRGWIKVHAMIDVETNQILGLEVTDESSQDDQMFIPLLHQVTRAGHPFTVKQVLDDGAYDRNQIFNILEKEGIVSGIKNREDASTRSTGSAYRAECTRDRKRRGGYRSWAEYTRYGMRWKVEGVFSSVKRIFGESRCRVSPRRPPPSPSGELPAAVLPGPVTPLSHPRGCIHRFTAGFPGMEYLSAVMRDMNTGVLPCGWCRCNKKYALIPG